MKIYNNKVGTYQLKPLPSVKGHIERNKGIIW